MQFLLVNPNTNVATTERMVEIAREAAPPDAVIKGATAAFGVPLITEPSALAMAADAVEALVRSTDMRPFDGVIVAAFGDPGLDRIRALVPCRVTGIAEAGLAECSIDTTQQNFDVEPASVSTTRVTITSRTTAFCLYM